MPIGDRGHYEAPSRRTYLKLTGGAALTAGLAGCLGDDDDDDDDTGLTELTRLESEGGIVIPVSEYAEDEGVFADHGLTIDVEIVPFGRYNRSVVDDEAQIGSPSATDQLGFMAAGEDLVLVGQVLNWFHRTFASADADDINSPPDLEDRVLGLPPEGSTTTTFYDVWWKELFDFDIWNDPSETISTGAPALYELMVDGEVDAMMQFSGQTIQGTADERFKVIWDPIEALEERGITPPPVTANCTRMSFLEENTETVHSYLESWDEAKALAAEEPDQVLDEYGELIGIEAGGDEAEVVEQMFADDIVFGPTFYDDDVIDEHYGFFQDVAEATGMDLVDRDVAFMSQTELEDML